MIKKIIIIKKNQEFQKIISLRQIVVNKEFLLFYRLNNNSNELRFGLSVGKKLGNSVLRNKTKRQIRHMLLIFSKDFSDLFLDLRSFDIIILVKKGYYLKLFLKNQKSLLYLLNKIVLKKEKK